MLSRTHSKLSSHRDSPALGEVNEPLCHLADKTNNVLQEWNATMLNEGQELAKAIQAVKTSTSDSLTPLQMLQASLTSASRALSGFTCKLHALRLDGGKVLEAARNRKATLEAEVNAKQSTLNSKREQCNTIQTTISSVTQQITDKETAAGQLDEAASSAKRHARRKKKRGVLGAVVGIVAAPFTMGASLALTAVGVGEIHNAEQAFSKANELRGQANAQRGQLPGLNTQLQTLQQELSSGEAQLTTLQAELGTLSSFVGAVEAAISDLHDFETSLNQAVANLGSVDAGLQEIALHTDAMLITRSLCLKSALTQAAGDQLYLKYKDSWNGACSFLDDNRSGCLTFH